MEHPLVCRLRPILRSPVVAPYRWRITIESTARLQGKRDAYLDQQLPDRLNYLLVQSAGNEGAQVNSSSDKMECGSKRDNLVFVGATTADGTRAEFSNYGTCVDVSALCDNVVLAAPDNFLNVESGTSFSAPLVVRYLSQNIHATDSIATMRGLLTKNIAGTEKEVAAANPKELAWADKDNAVETYALIAGQSSVGKVMHLPGVPALRHLK